MPAKLLGDGKVMPTALRPIAEPINERPYNSQINPLQRAADSVLESIWCDWPVAK